MIRTNTTTFSKREKKRCSYVSRIHLREPDTPCLPNPKSEARISCAVLVIGTKFFGGSNLIELLHVLAATFSALSIIYPREPSTLVSPTSRVGNVSVAPHSLLTLSIVAIRT